MTINISELQASINKAYRLISPLRKDLDLFKKNLKQLLSLIDEKESEENVKIHLMDFLKNTFYHPDHLIATKGKTDFVIHLGKEPTSPVGVLFEVKRPGNKADMVTQNNLNTKAMHELVLYFFRERSKEKNNSITHLVITNIYEWFIFDAQLFERVFTKNVQLQKSYKEWENNQKVSNSTDHFYKEIAKPFLDEFDKEISFTYFDFKKFIPLLNKNTEKDNALIPLYKFFTPVHLLKLPFLNDSNSLDKGFFSELLHIIGLEEIKENGRKVIRRLPEGRRQPASFIENTIDILKVENAFHKVPFELLQGANKEEQLFNISLELSITWINRILFLKLLEAQLLKYHQGDRLYRFLNQQIIQNYNELYKLFFQVLAKEHAERNAVIQSKYAHIPYLNSSLFEFSDLEECTIKINGLDDNLDMELYSGSVLKKAINYNRLNTKNTLHYLFDFLDAYKFSSIGKEEVQEENKTIINAAVLGLVFEKINGYKDGSIYTPGAITTFLCKETIRRAVVKKFNDENTWECETIDDVKNYLSDKRNTKDVLKFNRQIESVRIADPAVGSGHFLVSSLNELISIKSELGILADSTGNRLSEIEVSIANDELLVNYHDSKFFEYTIKSSSDAGNIVSTAEQRIQSTLFDEKRKIIEHCLFGVDINPNSVKICRLRLWIELLKHTYYKPDSNFKQLETLPNIDINIKRGNSLLSKYSLKEDLSEVFRKQKFSVVDYQLAVEAYKETSNKDSKEQLKVFIKSIKDQFHETVSRRDPRRKKLSSYRGDLAMAQSNFDLFGQKRSEKEMELEVRRISLNIEKIEAEIKEIENNVIYRNAFEWRFEFPEVLDEKGDFEGFEVIIGNPPYIQLQKMGAEADALQKCGYETFERTGDIYCLFYEQAQRLLKPDYFFGYITSNKWMRANYGKAMRKFFLEKTNPLLLIDFGGYQVFDSATVDANMLVGQNSDYQGKTETCLLDKSLGSLEKMSDYFKQHSSTVQNFSKERGWVVLSEIEATIKSKIESIGRPLKDWDVQINYGIKTGFNEAFIIDNAKRDELLKNCPKAVEIIRPILRGRDVKKYKAEFGNMWLINSHNGDKKTDRINLEISYPHVYNYLKQYETQLIKRYDKGFHWSNLRNCAYLAEIEKPKIIWIELSDSPKFAFDNEGYFVEATAFIMTGNHLKFLTAFLNSKLSDWYFDKITTTSGVGTNRWKKIYIENLPIPLIDKEREILFNELIDDVMMSKQKGDPIDGLDQQINKQLLELYDFNEDEKELVLNFYH